MLIELGPIAGEQCYRPEAIMLSSVSAKLFSKIVELSERLNNTDIHFKYQRSRFF